MSGSSGARNATDAGGSGGDSSSSTSSRRTNRLPRTPSTSTGTSSPAATSSSRSSDAGRRAGPLRVGPRRAVPIHSSPEPLVPEQAVRAEARQQLVPQLLARRHLVREQLRREQPLHQVVDAPVALAPRQPEHAAHRVRLEHGARDVRRRPEPVDRRPALEVERRERPLRADPLEDLRRDLGVLGEDALLEPRRVQPPRHAVPRQLARRQQREALVVRLEQLAPHIEELLAPGRVVVGDARVQHESWLRPATDSGSNWTEPSRRNTSSTASGPPSRDRAGASRWRATRKRRAASAETSTGGTLVAKRFL